MWLEKRGELEPEDLSGNLDFALWSTACETALWPAGTFLRAYNANRRSAIEDVVEADPCSSPCPGNHGEQGHVEWERVRPIACRCQYLGG